MECHTICTTFVIYWSIAMDILGTPARELDMSFCEHLWFLMSLIYDTSSWIPGTYVCLPSHMSRKRRLWWETLKVRLTNRWCVDWPVNISDWSVTFSEVTLPSLIVVNLSNDGYFLPPGAVDTERHLLDFLDGVLESSIEVSVNSRVPLTTTEDTQCSVWLSVSCLSVREETASISALDVSSTTLKSRWQ